MGALSSYRDLLLPTVWQAAGRSKCIDADIRINFVSDAIELVQTRVLFTREELDSGDFKRLAGPRLTEMFGLSESDHAKTQRVERRRLMWRGQQSRNGIRRPRQKKRVA